jgi:uncharacterized coiled-coil DUF342 family protein
MGFEDLIKGAKTVLTTVKETVDIAIDNATTDEEKQQHRYEESLKNYRIMSQTVIRLMGDASLSRKELERMEAAVVSLEANLTEARAQGESQETLDALVYRISQTKQKIEQKRLAVADKQAKAEEGRQLLDEATGKIEEMRDAIVPTADGFAAAQEAIAAAHEASREVARELAEARAMKKLVDEQMPPAPKSDAEEALSDLLSGGQSNNSETAPSK